MEINIEPNSNCGVEGQFMFVETSKPQVISWMMAYIGGEDVKCSVVGVYADGSFGSAYVAAIDDSGDATAFLIYGGEWGIRYQPFTSQQPWDLSNSTQHGDAYKIYSSADDVG